MSILHQQDVHLVDYLRILYKHRLFFVIVLIAAIGGVSLATSRQTPIYQASARILVDNEATIVDFPGVNNFRRLRLDTELHLMRSEEVASHAVRTRLMPGVQRHDVEFRSLVDQLRAATSVELVRNTLIVEMKIHTDSPDKAELWAEAMSNAYVELNFESSKERHAAGAAAIREQIDKTNRELEQAERHLLDFKAEHNIVSGQKNMGTAQSGATVKAIEAQGKYRALKRWYDAGDFTLPLSTELAPSPLVQDFYAQVVRKKTELDGLLKRYRSRHPKVEGVRAELATLERNFDQEIRNALSVLRKEVEVFSGIKREFITENERDWQLRVKQRQVDVKDMIHQSLLAKLGEIDVATTTIRNNVRVVEAAKAIPFPVRPNWKFNILVGIAFGFAVGLAGVFFREYLDNKYLRTPDDVARYLELPVLAVVPLARAELLEAPYDAPRLGDGGTGAATA